VRGGQSWDNNGEEWAARMELDGGLVQVWTRGNQCGEELWGEESEALVPFIGRQRRGVAERGGEQSVAMGIKVSTYCAGFEKGNRGGSAA
jgi:hypothetical protein